MQSERWYIFAEKQNMHKYKHRSFFFNKDVKFLCMKRPGISKSENALSVSNQIDTELERSARSWCHYKKWARLICVLCYSWAVICCLPVWVFFLFWLLTWSFDERCEKIVLSLNLTNSVCHMRYKCIWGKKNIPSH